MTAKMQITNGTEYKAAKERMRILSLFDFLSISDRDELDTLRIITKRYEGESQQ